MSGLPSDGRAARSIGTSWPPPLWLAYVCLGLVAIGIYLLL